MSVYIVSNDYFLQSGIIELGKELNIDIFPIKIKDLTMKKLTHEDCIIIHLNLKNKSCAKEISSIHNKSKVMIILKSQREIIISQSDMIMNSKKNLSEIKMAIYYLVNMKKTIYKGKNILSDLELKIISETLKGFKIDIIARNLFLEQKKVYTQRNNACKKLGGKRIYDLLLIGESLTNNLRTRKKSCLHRTNTKS